MGAKRLHSEEMDSLTLTFVEFSRAVSEELSVYYASATFGGLVALEAEIVALGAWNRAVNDLRARQDNPSTP